MIGPARSVFPANSEMIGVAAEPVTRDGRQAVLVSLTADIRAGTLGTDFGDEPTFLLLQDEISDGVLEVDLLAVLRPDAPDYARGFIGLAYRVEESGRTFECVYLRPTNGRGLNPPPPRHQRAIQYFAYPDWKYDRLRTEHQGLYEAGADIAPGEWASLRLDIRGRQVVASINGRIVLSVEQAKAEPKPGRIGLWVDIGTDGYFANLAIHKA